MGRGSFAAALRSPRKFRSASLVLHVAPGRPEGSRLGISAPKRLARRAVDRNRMKRVARELFRRHRAKEAGLDLVLAPREPFSREREAEWKSQALELLERAAGGR